MKKIISFVAILFAVFALSSCSKKTDFNEVFNKQAFEYELKTKGDTDDLHGGLYFGKNRDGVIYYLQYYNTFDDFEREAGTYQQRVEKAEKAGKSETIVTIDQSYDSATLTLAAGFSVRNEWKVREIRDLKMKGDKVTGIVYKAGRKEGTITMMKKSGN